MSIVQSFFVNLTSAITVIEFHVFDEGKRVSKELNKNTQIRIQNSPRILCLI